MSKELNNSTFINVLESARTTQQYRLSHIYEHTIIITIADRGRRIKTYGKITIIWIQTAWIYLFNALKTYKKLKDTRYGEAFFLNILLYSSSSC